MANISESIVRFDDNNAITLEHVASKSISNTKNIEPLEKMMLEQPQVDTPVTHKFGPGVYMREVFLPKGTLVIGHHHIHEHTNIFLKGKMTFFKDDGDKAELSAPLTMVSGPGRKIAFTHEDCIWINVYSTEETDVEKLEEQLFIKSETWLKDNALKISKTLSQGDKTCQL